MNKILVTGGLGFIGSTLIKKILSDTSDKILNIDKLSYASMPESLNEIKNDLRYSFKKIDICDLKALKDTLFTFSPNIIIHLAAESHVDNSISSPQEFIHTNIVGTYNLLEVSRELWKKEINEHNKFIHVSTDEVYGSLKNEDSPFDEENNYKPNSPYSASKASSDMLVRAWNKTFNLPCIITNCSNNYGPWQFPEKLIPVVIKSALNHQEIPIYGDGTNIRDWLYVEDHASALIQVYKTGKIGEKYNVGGNNEVSNIDLVNTICTILDEVKPSTKIKHYSELITYVTDRLGHDSRYAIDAQKILKELQFKPSVEIRDGLMKTVLWYVENIDWLNKKN